MTDVMQEVPLEPAPDTPPEPRAARRRRRSPFIPHIAAVLLALGIGALLMLAIGVNPIEAYAALLDGAFGNRNSMAETLLRTIPLALAGIGVALAFQAGLFNIGAEGQIFLGGVAAAWVGLQLAELPAPLLLAAMMLAAMVAGGLWAGIAALLKLWRNANEFINTIMLNYIAVFLVGWLLHGPLQEPGSPLGQTARLADAAVLPTILSRTRLHAGFFLALAAAALVHFLLWHTTWGFRLRVAGKNRMAARNAGMPIAALLFSSFWVSGMLAGLAGFTEVAGVQERMIENLSPGYGYTAIVVALLGQLNPAAVLAAAVLFAALQVGAGVMESAVGVPSSIVTVVQYLIVIFVIGRGGFELLRPTRKPTGQP
ncbi:MAG: ABC transporter permease [Caldilineaceae bacterium]|nr:ABC transporter permease [Caldilineaceae bacterium]